MPLSVTVGVFALLAVVAWQLASRARVSRARTAVSVVGVWIVVMFVAILAWALGTLVFGR